MTRRSLELTRTLREGQARGLAAPGDRPHRHADGGPAAGRLADLAPDARAELIAERHERRRRAGRRRRRSAADLREALGEAVRPGAAGRPGRHRPGLAPRPRRPGPDPRPPARGQGPAHRAGARSGSPSWRRRSSSAPRSAPSIEAALVDDPPLAIKEGGLIRDGYHPDLDELRELGPRRQDLDRPLPGRAGPPDRDHGLKVGFNKVFGYYIEITHAQAQRDEVPGRLHPQADRQERRALHHARAEGIRGQGPQRRGAGQRAGIRAVRHPPRPGRGRRPPADPGRAPCWPRSTSCRALAELAARQGYCRPEIVDEPIFEIEAGPASGARRADAARRVRAQRHRSSGPDGARSC